MATRRVKAPLSVCLGCIAALVLPSGAVQAQKDFPNRPVRLVNPFAPGGSVDLVARSVAAGLTEIWGQQLIVDNRAGAGTTIGSEIVAKADGTKRPTATCETRKPRITFAGTP